MTRRTARRSMSSRRRRDPTGIERIARDGQQADPPGALVRLEVHAEGPCLLAHPRAVFDETHQQAGLGLAGAGHENVQSQQRLAHSGVTRDQRGGSAREAPAEHAVRVGDAEVGARTGRRRIVWEHRRLEAGIDLEARRADIEGVRSLDRRHDADLHHVQRPGVALATSASRQPDDRVGDRLLTVALGRTDVALGGHHGGHADGRELRAERI
jgi:hypothetical protein